MKNILIIRYDASNLKFFAQVVENPALVDIGSEV